MASNRVIAFMGTRKVEVQSTDYPKLVGRGGRKCDHGVILKIITTNICGSDQHLHGFHHWYLKPARLPIPPKSWQSS